MAFAFDKFECIGDDVVQVCIVHSYARDCCIEYWLCANDAFRSNNNCRLFAISQTTRIAGMTNTPTLCYSPAMRTAAAAFRRTKSSSARAVMWVFILFVAWTNVCDVWQLIENHILYFHQYSSSHQYSNQINRHRIPWCTLWCRRNWARAPSKH